MKLFSPFTAAFLLSSTYLATSSNINESASGTQILPFLDEKDPFIQFLESNGIPFDTFKNTGRLPQIAHDFNGPYAIHFQKLINYSYYQLNEYFIAFWSSFAERLIHTLPTTALQPWTDVHNTHQEYIRMLKEDNPDSFFIYKINGRIPSIDEYEHFMVCFESIQINNHHHELGDDWDEFTSKLPVLLKEDLYATDEKFKKYFHPLIEELNIDELVWVRFAWISLKDPIIVMRTYFNPIARTCAFELFKEKSGVNPDYSDLPYKYRSMDRNNLYEWGCLDQSDSHQEYEECAGVFNNFILPILQYRFEYPPTFMNIRIMCRNQFDVFKKATPLFPSFGEHKLDNIYECQKFFQDLKYRYHITLSQLSTEFDEEIGIKYIEYRDYEGILLRIFKGNHFAPYIKDSIAGFRSPFTFISEMAQKLDKIPEFGYDKDSKVIMTFLESITCNGVPLFKEFPGSLDKIDEFLSSTTHYLSATKLMEIMGLDFEGDRELDSQDFYRFISSIDVLLEFVEIPDYSDLLVDIKGLLKVIQN